MAIHFFNADVNYVLKNKTGIRHWLIAAARKEGFQLKELNIIFCSDEYLYKMNLQFLKHDTYTDIITFSQGNGKFIEGELYISFERVKENAALILSPITQELHRVIVHGVLHLCGYSDKTKALKGRMSTKEDFYLSLRKFL